MFNTLYFTCIGWAVFYIVWKWSINAPIIAGRRKRSATDLAADGGKFIKNGFSPSPTNSSK
jgi:hypothetical protein